MSTISPKYSVQSLKRALALTEQIAALEAELATIFSGEIQIPVKRAKAGRPRKQQSDVVVETKKGKKRKKRVLSAEAKARIVEAQKKRWAKARGE